LVGLERLLTMHADEREANTLDEKVVDFGIDAWILAFVFHIYET
jgi:hypothetical protein